MHIYGGIMGIFFWYNWICNSDKNMVKCVFWVIRYSFPSGYTPSGTQAWQAREPLFSLMSLGISQLAMLDYGMAGSWNLSTSSSSFQLFKGSMWDFWKCWTLKLEMHRTSWKPSGSEDGHLTSNLLHLESISSWGDSQWPTISGMWKARGLRVTSLDNPVIKRGWTVPALIFCSLGESANYCWWIFDSWLDPPCGPPLPLRSAAAWISELKLSRSGLVCSSPEWPRKGLGGFPSFWETKE